MDELIIDLFAGGGGASTGIEAALGRPVDIAINHSPIALAVHAKNHPGTKHLTCDIWEARPADVTGGRPVGLLWASPDCTHFSNAKGGKPRSQKIRSLAWVVVRWASAVRPRVIFLENVREFQTWGPLGPDGKPDKARMGITFRRWLKELRSLGYQVDYRVLNACDYGAPTRRKRLFLVARCDGAPIVWPEPTHGNGLLPFRTAAECIDWTLDCPSIFGRKKPLAEKTLWRVAQGIRKFVLETPEPFIVKVNHGKRQARNHSIHDPLSTITAGQRGHALVAPTLVQTGQGERAGQRPRFLNIQAPLGTVVACGQRHALVAAFLAKHYGDPLRKSGGGVVLGSDLGQSLDTITATDHHSLAAVCLAKFRGTHENQPSSADVGEPLPTTTAGGMHVAEVRAFLTAYYSTDGGQSLKDPLRTVTTKDRLGLVTVMGVDYQIADIGLRMLQPEELLIGNFGDYAKQYDISAAPTKEAKIRLIGNSVCPDVAAALVRANLRGDLARAA
jgi:DNA (cytosine-5)-methyltransferase 1